MYLRNKSFSPFHVMEWNKLDTFNYLEETGGK